MLHLKSQTEAVWLERALASMPDILLDHAHCEKKAASTALSLIFKYPEHRGIVEPLSRLAREELAHFEEVLRHLDARGLVFRRQKPSPYAGKLMTLVRNTEPQKMLDTFIACAFIEARSCERMKLLVSGLDADKPLQELYRGLLIAEARHHRLFIDLILETGAFEKAVVDQRIEEFAHHEAAVIAEAPPEPRMHN
jgi:tRNA-(ms[2]io[6]A)-hydroxylase